MKPFDGPFNAVIRPPGSKSLSNRALVMAALGDGPCKLSHVLFADDTRVMLDGLSRLGFKLEIDEPAKTVIVHGERGVIPATSADLFCGNSGTTIRFLAALSSLGRGEYRLDGIERMRQRPIGLLVDLLKNLGSRIEYEGQSGFPPLKIFADSLPGGMIRYPMAASSQFLSSVLMIAPYTRHEVRVDLDGEQTSWPYVWMTMRLMDQFGLTPELLLDRDTGKPRQITVPSGHYSAREYPVEPDASNAAYFMAIGAVHPGSSVTVQGLGSDSLQGDVQFAGLLKRMGASVAVGKNEIKIIGTDELEGLDVSLLDMPDQAQTLGVLALFAKGQTIIRGLHTLRLKETDRLAALSTELQKLGAAVKVEGDDTLIIDPPHRVAPAQIDTYDDHRMAMSFALAGTKSPGVVIKDAQCVSKTYPEFFHDLGKLLQ
jgi:3-phosphoshikimate 1-carboxyvinyltransferase